MKKALLLAILIIASIASVNFTQAQTLGIKTNIAYWGTGTINLGLEPALSPHSTLVIDGMGNPWRFKNNQKSLFWAVQPEYRYWLCEKFDGHFFGVHTHYANFNIALNDFRHQGWLAGAGLSYGYDWRIARSWRFEATLGVGYAYIDYDRYRKPKCSELIAHNIKHYFGPTKFGLTFTYLIQ